MKLNLALVGYGVMGQDVEKNINHDQFNLKVVIDHNSPAQDRKEVTAANLKGCDVAICFTTKNVAKMVEILCQNNVKVVLASTGWDSELELVKKHVKQYKGAVIASSNFSLGVLIYFEMLKFSSQLINKFPSYFSSGYEVHHREKSDWPSGTMKKCAAILRQNLKRQDKIIYQLPIGRKINEDELHLSSIRGGSHAGLHEIEFDSKFDTISLVHKAKTKQGFALGALYAAKWVADKEGYFTEDDLGAELS